MRAVATLALLLMVSVAAVLPVGAGNAEVTNLMATSSAAPARVLTVAQAAGLPPTIQEGIGPGSALQQGVDGIQFICSASFLLRDPATATYYLSTAGHCLVRDATDGTPYTGAANPDRVKNRVDICVDGCLNNGLGLGTYVSLQAGEGYHPVTYAESGGIGQDFGIIEIPAELHDLLRPAMPQWGGPIGLDDGSTGDTVVHYGHGTLVVPGVVGLVTRTPADQGRLAIHFGADGRSFSAFGHVTGGDSGSGAAMAALDPTGLATGEGALGVITHSIVYVGAPIMSGTLMTHGLEMVRDATGLALELVDGDDPLTATALAPAAIEIRTPAERAATPATGDLTIHGVASGPGGTTPVGVVQVAIDDDSFSAASRIPVVGAASWNATWSLGGETPGPRTIFVRLVDDERVVAQANRTIEILKKDGSSASGSAKPPASSSASKPPSSSAAPASSKLPSSSAASGQPASSSDGSKASPLGIESLVALVVVAWTARRRA
ncbi:MAG: hypothetical protein AABX89_05925 [Candidatus Thermoplasmatota archaeon]